MANKRTQEENIQQLTKLAQADFTWKMAMTVLAGVGGYYGYLYASQKSEEFQQTIEETKIKLAKIPFIGGAFKES